MASIGDDGSRSFTTTPDDHGGIALTVCTLLATWSVLCYFVRICVRLNFSGPFGVDDIVCAVATVLGIAQTIASSAAIAEGFGKSMRLLNGSQTLHTEKALYAAQLLYILTNATTKCAVALLLLRITPVKLQRIGCYCVLGTAAAWGAASFLAEATRCLPQHPWVIVDQHCTNSLVAWQAITAVNIIIEIALFAIPVRIVWGLQTSLDRKVTVIFIFGLRLPVIAAAIARLHFLASVIGSADPLFTGVNAFVCLQAEMHYGLIASTIPTLRPFVSAFDSGFGTGDTQGITEYSLQSLDKKKSQGRSRGLSGKNNSTQEEDEIELRPGQVQLCQPQDGKNVTRIYGQDAQPSSVRPRSSHSSERMFIRQTHTVEVQYGDSLPQSQAFRSEARPQRRSTGYDL